jgi:hypothetical protein
VFNDSVEKLQAAIDYLTNPTMKDVKMLEPKIEDLASAVNANTAAIRELIKAISNGVPTTAAQVAAVVEEVKAEAPAKTEKKAKAEKTEAPKAEPAATPEPKEEAAPAADEGPGEPEVTYQDAAAAITALSKTKGRDAAVALLKKFGASKLPEVKPEDFAAIVAEAKATS